jgi:hypothetical protein
MMNELTRLENSRKAVMKLYLINGVFLLLCLFAFLGFRETSPGVVVVCILVTFGFFVAFTLPKHNAYKNQYKREVVETILKRTFDNLYFEPKKGLSRDVIAGTGMMMMGNRYSSNDYISGRYKNTGFAQSDVCIQHVTRRGKNTHTTTYFRGRWMIFDFNKNFAADLLVRENGFYYTKQKGGWFSPEEERMERLKLEDEQFNREFDVFAQNEHEAYYILTPHIMESIRDLNAKISGKLVLCFVASKLHVGVHNNKDAFEPPIFRTIDETLFAEIENDIKVITSFIDELNLDRNIYKH